MADIIILWHGAHRWQGPPEIRAASAKRTAHGPGLYMTTGVDTARRYARGGGAVMRFEIARPLRWVDDVTIPHALVQHFLVTLPRLRKRKEILADVRTYLDRRLGGQTITPATEVPALSLLNLMAYRDAIEGERGVALADFLRKRGVDAAFVSNAGNAGNEDWVVLFNLDKIVSYRKATAEELADQPRISHDEAPRYLRGGR